MGLRCYLLDMRLLLLFFLSCLTLYSASITGSVVGVTDGDTITVLDADKVQHKIRLYGIDAPEIDQFGGLTAQSNLRGILEKNTFFTDDSGEVKIEIVSKDKYGRSVAKVYKYGNVYVNEIMLERGQAWLDERYIKKGVEDDDLRLADAIGKSKRISFMKPWIWRELKKEEKLAIEKDYFTVNFESMSMTVTYIPYVIEVKKNHDAFFFCVDKEIPKPGCVLYPYSDDIKIALLKNIIKIKALCEKYKFKTDVEINKKLGESTHGAFPVGDVRVVGEINGKKFDEYVLKTWMHEDGLIDTCLFSDEHPNSFGVGFGKGFYRIVPITPKSWNNMDTLLASYMEKKLYEITSDEAIMPEDSDVVPSDENKGEMKAKKITNIISIKNICSFNSSEKLIDYTEYLALLKNASEEEIIHSMSSCGVEINNEGAKALKTISISMVENQKKGGFFLLPQKNILSFLDGKIIEDDDIRVTIVTNNSSTIFPNQYQIETASVDEIAAGTDEMVSNVVENLDYLSKVTNQKQNIFNITPLHAEKIGKYYSLKMSFSISKIKESIYPMRLDQIVFMHKNKSVTIVVTRSIPPDNPLNENLANEIISSIDMTPFFSE